MWFFLALGTALSQAAKDVLIKKNTRCDGLVLCCAYCWMSTAMLLFGLAATGVPDIRPDFWVALGSSAALNSVALTLYFTAIRASDLSLTAPMLTFTPLFLLATSPLLVGEYPDAMGGAGIVCIVAGSYILHLKARRSGFLGPVRALVSERGPRLMLLVAFLWSIGANLDKIGVLNSSPLMWLCALYGTIAAILTPFALVRIRRLGRAALPRLGQVAVLSLFEASGLVLQMLALTLTIVPYVIATKRLSGVFGVVFGSIFLGEKGVGERLAGASLMVAGVMCIAFFGS
ncbi:MAG: EamA family transporter [Desulfovibrionaceae bacterium]